MKTLSVLVIAMLLFSLVYNNFAFANMTPYLLFGFGFLGLLALKEYQSGKEEKRESKMVEIETSDSDDKQGFSKLDDDYKELKRSKLTIELQDIGVSTFSPDFHFGIYSNWRKWKAYEGFIPISEERFFSITGYQEEAKTAKKYRADNSFLIIGGLVLSLGGLAIMYAGYTATETIHYEYLGSVESLAPNYGIVLLGLAISGFGDGLCYSGIIRSRKNWAPYSLVQEISNEYNENLVAEE